MPVKIERNEDGQFHYATRPPTHQEEWPKKVMCWDCEEYMEDVFGGPCPSEVDHRGFSDNAWEGIP